MCGGGRWNQFCLCCPFGAQTWRVTRLLGAILNLCAGGSLHAPVSAMSLLSRWSVFEKKSGGHLSPLLGVSGLVLVLRPGIPGPANAEASPGLLVSPQVCPLGGGPPTGPKGDWDLSGFRSKGWLQLGCLGRYVHAHIPHIHGYASTYLWTTLRSERNFKLELGLPGHLKVYLIT